jgi:hypothetical protein
MAAQAPRTAPDRRRNLLGMTGFIVVLLIVNGTIGWLGIRYAALANERGLATLETLTRAETTAREAQVEFKVQVQEWKNVLIRGHDARDHARHWEAFGAREAAVQRHLESLVPVADRIGSTRTEAEALQAAHRVLGVAYREALEAFRPVEDALSLRTVDARVRGQDRALSDALDALADRARLESARVSAELQEAARHRAERLETFALAAMLGTLLLLLFMTFFTSRRN